MQIMTQRGWRNLPMPTKSYVQQEDGGWSVTDPIPNTMVFHGDEWMTVKEMRDRIEKKERTASFILMDSRTGMYVGDTEKGACRIWLALGGSHEVSTPTTRATRFTRAEAASQMDDNPYLVRMGDHF